MAKLKAPGQMLRIDGKNCFAEVMCGSLPIDKVLINFVAYNANNAKGSRETGHVSIYMNIFEAKVLAGDILSGKLARDAKEKEAEAAAKAALPENKGKRFYPEPSYLLLGGTSANRTSDNKPISRQFKISKGVSMPWVLEATSGPGKTIGKGLIAPDGLPTTVIRIGMKDETIKQFAYAIQMCCDLWAQAKYLPVLEPLMAEVKAQTEAAFKALSDGNQGGSNNGAMFENVEEDELPY